MATNFVADPSPLKLTAPSGGVVSGTPKLIGSVFGVPLASADEGDLFALAVEGVFTLDKTTGITIAEGDSLYWSTGTSKVTKTATDTAIGFATEAAGSSATTCKVRLVAGAPAADVNATTVNAAGAVMESDFNAQTILAATADDTPVALTVAEDTLVGRTAGNNIDALTATEVRTLLNVEDGADVTDATNVDAAAQDLIAPEHLAVKAANIGVPFIIEFDASAASAAIDIFNGDCPHKIDILDFAVLSTATNANATAKLNDAAGGGGNDITDAVVGTPVNTLSRAAEIIVAERQIAENGSLSVVKNAAGDDVTVIITAVRVA